MRVVRMALALAAVSSAVVLAEPPLQLRYRVGQTMRFRLTSTTVQSLKRGETTSGTTIRLTQEILRQGEQVAGDGSAWLTSLYTQVACVLEVGPNRVEFDSTKPEDAAKASDPLLARFAGMAGKTVRLRVAPTGKMLEVQGFDEIAQAISARLDPAHPMTAQLRTSLEDHYTNAAMLRRIQATAEVFPAAPVGQGGTWSRTGVMPNPAVKEIMLDFTYTWAGNEAMDGVECAHIVGEATMKLPKEPPIGSRYAGGSAILEAGTYRHDVWLDLPAGFVRSAKEVVKMRITGEVPGAAPQTESVEQETEMTYLGEK